MSWQDDTRVCAGLYRKRGNAEDSLYSSDIGSHINTLTTVLYCIKEWANIDLTLPIHHHYTVHVQKRATKLIHGFEKFSYSDRPVAVNTEGYRRHEIEEMGAKFQILTHNFSALKGFRGAILISGDAGRAFLSLIFAH